MKNKYEVKNLRLAELRYYSKEDNTILLSENLSYILLEKVGNSYTNIFDGETASPIFFKTPDFNTVLSDINYGGKVKFLNSMDKTGFCYIICKENLKDITNLDVISSTKLENIVMTSNYYFKDRLGIVRRRFGYNPFIYAEFLMKDIDNKEKMEEIFMRKKKQYKKVR